MFLNMKKKVESMITLYTIDCPKCKVLENLLKKKQISYTTVRDMELMKQKGFTECPKLEVNGQVLGFTEAVTFVKGQ